MQLEAEFTNYLMKEQLKKTKIKLFEMLIPKLLGNLHISNYDLDINFFSEGSMFLSKNYKMTSNLKLIKMVDFDEILNPKISDLFEEKRDNLNISQKKIYFKKNLYKFNSILSLIEHETSKDYIDNPCYLNGYYRKEPKILGSGNFDKCFKLINQIIYKLGMDKHTSSGMLNGKNLTSVI
jgi:hypothetical protein